MGDEVQLPAWAIAAFGIFTSALLAILGYLLRSMIGSITKQGEETKKALEKQGQETKDAIEELSEASKRNERKVSDDLARIDKRFVEEQLAQSRQYVDREGWTRDYVTLSQRIDGLHRRVDRVEREAPTTSYRRPKPSRAADTDPPDR